MSADSENTITPTSPVPYFWLFMQNVRRQYTGLSQTQAAHQAKLSLRTVQRLEQDQRVSNEVFNVWFRWILDLAEQNAAVRAELTRIGKQWLADAARPRRRPELVSPAHGRDDVRDVRDAIQPQLVAPAPARAADGGTEPPTRTPTEA
jgi:hypothetical protein